MFTILNLQHIAKSLDCKSWIISQIIHYLLVPEYCDSFIFSSYKNSLIGCKWARCINLSSSVPAATAASIESKPCRKFEPVGCRPTSTGMPLCCARFLALFSKLFKFKTKTDNPSASSFPHPQSAKSTQLMTGRLFSIREMESELLKGVTFKLEAARRSLFISHSKESFM